VPRRAIGVCWRWWALLSVVFLNACDEANLALNQPELQNIIPVVASFDDVSTATGNIMWEAVSGDSTALLIEIPEDTLLQLSIDAAPDIIPVSISRQPNRGAAAFLDGLLEYNPDKDFFGTDALQLQRGASMVQLRIDVKSVNDAPRIMGDIARVAVQGEAYIASLNVKNVDGDALRFSAANLPDWLQINARTGVLYGVPTQADVGLHEGIRLIVRDASGLDDALSNVTIEVLDVNDVSLTTLCRLACKVAVSVF